MRQGFEGGRSWDRRREGRLEKELEEGVESTSGKVEGTKRMMGGDTATVEG